MPLMPLGTGRYLNGCDKWRRVASGGFRSRPGGGHAARRAWRVQVSVVAAALDVLDALRHRAQLGLVQQPRGSGGTLDFAPLSRQGRPLVCDL
jgi:hypothetical protein